MGFTAIIYSKEEALAMQPSDRPMCYRVPSKIYHDTFQAIGQGSMCWEPRPSGTFDTSEAEKAGLNLLFSIASELEKAGLNYENWPETWK